MKLDLKSGVVGVAGAVTVGALALGGAALANADPASVPVHAVSGASSTASPSGAPGRGRGPAGHGAPGQQGKRPDLSVHGLTGDTAVKVTQAAVAKEPTAYLVRVGKATDGTYRAHMVRTDGTRIAVHIDANFSVTSVEDLPKKPTKPKGAPTATAAPSST